MMDGNMLAELCNRIAQDVSFKLSDMVVSYPDYIRPFVLATVQACLNAQLGAMPAKYRELYDVALDRMTVITIPKAMDPRKGGGGK